MDFKNIRAPLLILSVLLLNLSLGAALYFSTIQSYKDYESTLQQTSQVLEKKNLVYEMYAAARDRSVILFTMYREKDPFELDELFMEIKSRAAAFISAKQRLQSRNLTDFERQTIESANKSISINAPLQNRVAELFLEQHFAEGEKILLEQAIPSQNAILRTLKNFLEYYDNITQLDFSTLQSEHDEISHLYSLAAISVMVGGSLIMGFLIFIILQKEKNLVEFRLKQQQKEKQLHEACVSAEAASKNKTEFLANMSHEIRTPMNAILGFSEIALLDNSLNLNTQKNIEKIHSSADSLLTIINDILDLSKLENDKLELEAIPFKLPNLLQETLLFFEQMAADKSLQLQLKIHDGINENVVGDPTRLRQILINLIGNAIKFTEQGGVQIEVKTDKTSGKLHFSVTDTGIGMSPDQVKHVFDQYSQADNSVQRRYGGTGLGTCIGKQLVEKMGGKIWLESQPGTGTTFHFTLDLAAKGKLQADRSAIEQQVDTDKSAANTDLPQSAADVQILVVEDDQFNQELLRQQLAACGYQADFAENGLIGKQKWMQGNYHLILCDLRMPVMDGAQLIKEIRQQEKNSGEHITVIALTASAMADEMERCMQMGFDDYFSKPIDIGRLEALCDKWIRHGSRQTGNRIA